MIETPHYKVWVVDNKLHRTDGPAIIWTTGSTEWYIKGELYRSDKEFQEAANLSDEEMTLMILKYGNVK